MRVPAGQVSRPHGHVALGAWSGGRYLHFGEPITEERLQALLTPDDGITTILTADAYGAGEADTVVAPRSPASRATSTALIGAVGHDFYDGEREGAKGFPRFTDSRLRGEDGYADYLRLATERHIERLGVDELRRPAAAQPRPHGLHQPESSGTRWPPSRETGLTRRDRHRARARRTASRSTSSTAWSASATVIDWAMLILNPFEPWPGELALGAGRGARRLA